MEYRIDLFSIFIFLGIVQGVFLLFFFLSGENRKLEANRFHALLLFSMVACIVEIFLMYTGYIANCLYLVDFSEAIAFLIGPAFYLLVVSLVRGPLSKKQYWHFAFAAVYLVMQLPYLLLPDDFKYNSYITSYRPDLPYRDVEFPYDPDDFMLFGNHAMLVLISLSIYGVLGLLEVIKVFRLKKESFWNPQHPVLRTLRSGTLQILASTIIIVIVKLFNEHDYGDQWIAAYISLAIYFTSFSVIRNSGFFRQASLEHQQKYKTSSLTEVQQELLLAKLTGVMENEKPFLHPDFSLPELAGELKTSVHILSQAINEGLKKTFFEMTAEYRVMEAKRLLIEQPNIKVEEIAEQVGYSSKSSFNTAFKKITGKTPSEFRAS